MEGDGLEEDREKSKQSFGGGLDLNKLLGESGFEETNWSWWYNFNSWYYKWFSG